MYDIVYLLLWFKIHDHTFSLSIRPGFWSTTNFLTAATQIVPFLRRHNTISCVSKRQHLPHFGIHKILKLELLTRIIITHTLTHIYTHTLIHMYVSMPTENVEVTQARCSVQGICNMSNTNLQESYYRVRHLKHPL